MAKVYACIVCGCTDVEGQVWQHLNNNEVKDSAGDDVWCPECEDHHNAVCFVDDETKFCDFCREVHDFTLHAVKIEIPG